MTFLHQSRSERFRAPYGALKTGSTLNLYLQLEAYPDDGLSVDLCYTYGLYRFAHSRLRMNGQPVQDGRCRLQGRLQLPAEPCLLFYWFEIETPQGIVCYSRDHQDPDGGGQIVERRPHVGADADPGSLPWQVTVYTADFTVPSWLAGSVIYQIFPDRFNRDNRFATQRFDKNDRPDRIWHEDWSEDVDFLGKPETGYLACDFFGGSLCGITEKLDYLAGLGINILSLNPIFTARSNHRYDTGNYEQVDPLLGTEEDFVELCCQAESRGIRILLDGVFSHTGADSLYFNKYNNHPGTGAWQEACGQGNSDYGSWYTFHHKGDQVFYDSWWGFEELPSVNENDLSYQDYMTGPSGIVRKWLELGAAGWRLDVSDELPDLFLRNLRKAVHEQKDDAILLGEVWEDATCKISYGSFRDFLLGDTHDAVMGYPFQTALVGWLSAQLSTSEMHQQLETIREHYPLLSFYSSYNLISGHDIPRAVTVLAGVPDPVSRDAQAKTYLSAQQREKGEQLLRLAVAFQMTYPGCPVIYYGDETAMEGYRDPFNRRTFPWGRENQTLQNWFSWFAKFRNNHQVLRTGFFEFAVTGEDIVVFRRFAKAGQDVFGAPCPPEDILIAINRSHAPRQARIESRLLTLDAYEVLIEDNGCRVDPMASKPAQQ